MTNTADEGAREGIELMSTGALRVWIDGTPYRMRRPRVREFRQLREAIHDISDEITALADAAQRRQVEIATAISERDTPQTDDERLEVRKLGRELAARREELYLGWWALVGEKLCETSGWPDLDDMPAWAGEAESATELVSHWRSTPSLSGAR